MRYTKTGIDPISGRTDTSGDLATPEALAQFLSEIFGSAEMTWVSSNDPRIPAQLRVASPLAAILDLKEPETTIGVVCERLPEQLNAIVLADKLAFDAFIKQNPSFEKCLASNWRVTPSSKAYILWLRCEDSGQENWNYGKFSW